MHKIHAPLRLRKKHMAYRKKYKPYILKYKALISKYMPYIFRRYKHLKNKYIQNRYFDLYFSSFAAYKFNIKVLRLTHSRSIIQYY